MRRAFKPREAIAIRKLRMHHWPILNIAKLLRRSCSFVHRRLQFELQFHWKLRQLRHFDLRKLPFTQKPMIAQEARGTLHYFGDRWLQWLASEEGDPP